MRTVACVAVLTLTVAIPLDAQGREPLVYDFNGDGRAELVVGTPANRVRPVPEWRGETGLDAGVVNVLLGSPRGVSVVGDQLWSQSSPGIPGHPEGRPNEDATGDRFGEVHASDDFDGDGFADLAIGVPREGISDSTLPQGGAGRAGAVHIIYGSRDGLTAAGTQWLSQGWGGLGDTLESDHVGGALAAGDFNGDGFGDLAIGAPRESIGFTPVAGLVHVVYGSPTGLDTASTQSWHQRLASIPDDAEGGHYEYCGSYGDHFGAGLAAGDVNGDGRDDLAIGVPEEDADIPNARGAVHVLLGGSPRMTAAGNFFWVVRRNTRDEQGGIQGFLALSIGDYNGDGFGDVAVGSPAERVGSVHRAGAVHILYGSETSIGDREERWTTSSPGVPGSPAIGDGFGRALASGDVNADGRDDLAIVGGYTAILHGSDGGLSADSARRIKHYFARALSFSDHDGDGREDLAIGEPYASGGGRVRVVLANKTQTFTQDTPGVKGRAAREDDFGLDLGPERILPNSFHDSNC